MHAMNAGASTVHSARSQLSANAHHYQLGVRYKVDIFIKNIFIKNILIN